MTVTCPEGHQSEARDYCDICGTPIEASGSGAGSAESAAAGGSSTPGPVLPESLAGSVLDLDPAPAATLTCSHCGAPNVADALFCEACGYDFTTGAAPLGSEPAAADPDEEEAGDPDEDVTGNPDEEEAGDSDEDAAGSELDLTAGVVDEHEDDPDVEETLPEELIADEPEAQKADVEGPVVEQPHIEEPGNEEPGNEEPGNEEPSNEEPSVEEPDPVIEAPPSTAAVAAHVRPRHTPPSRDLADTWVVEVWIDPDWYAVQQTEEACPSPGLPDVVVVRRNVILVGRPSGSRGVRPDVDAGADSAVSRRHAQLTSDGSRWWIEDLGSSNGTYVGSVGEPLPTEPIRQRVEIDRDDRIYIGAWTRLVLRQATASEQAGQG